MLSGGLLTVLHTRDPKRVAVENYPCVPVIAVYALLARWIAVIKGSARSPFEFDFLHDVAGARDLERFSGKRARFSGSQAFRSISLIRKRTAAAIRAVI
jgi:hypothetical protein